METNSLKLIDESTEADLVVRPLLGDYHFTIYSDTSSIYLKEKQIDELIEYLTKLKEKTNESQQDFSGNE